MRWVADLIYLLAGLVYLPVALYNALMVGKNRRGWRQRFGFVPKFRLNSEGKNTAGRIWIHAVSLGEINATPKLVEALRQRLPHHDIVFSTTTDTGFARAVQLYGAEKVFRFPLDFSVVISRVLNRVAPTLIVLVELEVWYNLVRMATHRGISVAVVNGRLTQRSARRLSWLGRPVRSMFSDLAWVGAQDETIAARFRQLGVRPDRIVVTSSLKWDTALITDRVEGAEELALALGIDGAQPLWVCGSTGPGEEAIILEAYRKLLRNAKTPKRQNAETVGRASPAEIAKSPSCQITKSKIDNRQSTIPPLLSLVPRKPERFDEVAELIERCGFRCVRRSQRPDGIPSASHRETDSPTEPVVVLGDTMGELRKFYCLADVVFVGRSLVPMGGSDPMEVAALGKPILVGPHMENFHEPVEALKEAGAIRFVRTADDVASSVAELCTDRSTAQSLGILARDVVRGRQGATQITSDRLIDLLTDSASSAL